MSEEFSLTDQIKTRFPQRVLATHAYCGDQTVIIKRDGVRDVCQFLRDDPAMAFNVLMDLSATDYLTFGQSQSSAPTLMTPSPLPYFMKPKPTIEAWERLVSEEYRFEVVYHFYSLARNHRLRVKVPLMANDPVIESVTSLWPSANWYEREVWDMFGIRFTGHPDLRRILLYQEFEGHPLRKDYPITKRQPLIGPTYQDPNVAEPSNPIIPWRRAQKPPA